MNLWDFVWTALSWVLGVAFVIIGVGGILILAFACVVGLVRAVRGILAPAPKPDAKAIDELTDALVWTREYVGKELLPAQEGWSWYDCLRKYAPDKLKDMK